MPNMSWTIMPLIMKLMTRGLSNTSPCAQASYESIHGPWSATPPTTPPKRPTRFEEDRGDVRVDHESVIFSNFMSQWIINDIVKHTNEEIAVHVKTVTPVMRTTDEHELMGLWLNLGITGFKGVPVDSLFSTQVGSSSSDAQLTFSRDRYKFLMRALKFDDKSLRVKNDSGQTQDKFCPIRKIFEKFMTNCRSVEKAGEHITIDETLLGFRGRCSFRMYIPTKAEKFDIKIWTCVDARTKYLHTSNVYLGKQEAHEKNLGLEVVKKLSNELINEGRTIICDHFFTSPELGRNLWDQNTLLIGTVRSNRIGMPKDFVTEQLQVL